MFLLVVVMDTLLIPSGGGDDGYYGASGDGGWVPMYDSHGTGSERHLTKKMMKIRLTRMTCHIEPIQTKHSMYEQIIGQFVTFPTAISKLHDSHPVGYTAITEGSCI